MHNLCKSEIMESVPIFMATAVSYVYDDPHNVIHHIFCTISDQWLLHHKTTLVLHICLIYLYVYILDISSGFNHFLLVEDASKQSVFRHS